MSEHNEQVMLVKWLEAKGIPFFSVPNGAALGGGKAGRGRQMAILKSEGLRRGAPDLVLIRLALTEGVECNVARPIAIEMKAEDGILSIDQCRTQASMEREGWIVITAYGFDDARLQLEAHGL